MEASGEKNSTFGERRSLGGTFFTPMALLMPRDRWRGGRYMRGFFSAGAMSPVRRKRAANGAVCYIRLR